MLRADRSIRVCIVGQSPLASQYLVQILKREPQIVASIAKRCGSSITLDKGSQVFLLDVLGLSPSPTEWVRKLRVIDPDMKCILLDQEISGFDIVLCLGLGMKGFVSYLDVEEDLIRAIHLVASGKLWVTSDVLACYVRTTSQLSGKRSLGIEMTLREREIRELAQKRLSNKEIAERLGIQEATVKFHLSNIFSKLQITGRRQLYTETNCFGSVPRSTSR